MVELSAVDFTRCGNDATGMGRPSKSWTVGTSP